MELQPDKNELSTFISALFCHADSGTYVNLRSFDQFKRGVPAQLIRSVQVNGSLDHVIAEATTAATESTSGNHRWVFAPPVCTFTTSRTRAEDLANGLTLSVEVDEHVGRARQKLEFLLGPATIIVASGSDWINPDTGELEPKLHLHWRLSEPTRDPEDHARLLHCRHMATHLVGADPTGKPIVHPLRWPGSWNVKATPRMARIVARTDHEIHLVEAVDLLESAVDQAGLESVGRPVSSAPEDPTGLYASAMAAVPNPDLHYGEWIKFGYACYRASGGADDGFDAWNAWSRKSSKYDAAQQEATWKAIGNSVSTSSATVTAGAGTIFFYAMRNGWERPIPEPPPDINDPGYYSAQEEWARSESAPEQPSQPRKSSLWIVREAWQSSNIPRRPWIARGYLMRGSLTVLSGAGAAGKSSLMVGWATTMAVGCNLRHLKVAAPMRVATYNVEDDENEQKRRFSAMLAQLKLAPDAWEDRLAILGPTNVGTLLTIARDGGIALNTTVMDELEEFVAEFKPDVLMLDPFVELHGAEENDNTAVRAVLARFRAMAVEYNMAVVILHHSRKGTGDPGDPDTLRGASSIVGAARVVLTVSVMSKDEAEQFAIPEKYRRDYFRLDGAKSNYAAIYDTEWFERREIVLDNGDDDNPPDKVAVAWPWEPPTLWTNAPADALNRALDIIDQPPAGWLYAPTRRGRDNRRWAGTALVETTGCTEKQAAMMIAEWLKSGLLYEETYRDDEQRKDRVGVRVNHTKRPS